MSYYDFKAGRKRIIETLSSKTKIQELDTIPKNDSEFTYENGIRSWVGSVFIDIVNSSNLFKEENYEQVARIMRAFSSEIISILDQNPNYRQIGIRGDCVYAIYSAPKQTDLVEILSDAICINTLQKMFQKILQQNNFPTFNIGIGLGASKDLIVKTGKKNTGISDNIWIGPAVVNASKLSSEAGRHSYKSILMDGTFYSNIKDYNANDDYTYDYYISKTTSQKLNEYVYGCDMIQTQFNNWIDGGMKN